MPDRRNLYFYHNHDKNLEDKIATLHSLANQLDLIIVEDASLANIIVSIGGDADFLQAVRKTGFRHDCLYMGISTRPTETFYCDFKLDDTEKLMAALTTREIEVRRYPIIEVSVNNQIHFKCLNEISLRSSIIKAISMDLYIDQFHFETFKGDGVIVSTPTGSTAYNRSLGGAVVDPMLPCFQVTEVSSLNNNSYRTLGSPIILSGDKELTIRLRQDGSEHPIIGMDNEALNIREVEDVKVRLSEQKIKTIKLRDNSFWEKVQRNFL